MCVYFVLFDVWKIWYDDPFVPFGYMVSIWHWCEGKFIVLCFRGLCCFWLVIWTFWCTNYVFYYNHVIIACWWPTCGWRIRTYSMMTIDQYYDEHMFIVYMYILVYISHILCNHFMFGERMRLETTMVWKMWVAVESGGLVSSFGATVYSY
jgi:hypothetical protein